MEIGHLVGLKNKLEHFKQTHRGHDDFVCYVEDAIDRVRLDLITDMAKVASND